MSSLSSSAIHLGGEFVIGYSETMKHRIKQKTNFAIYIIFYSYI